MIPARSTRRSGRRCRPAPRRRRRQPPARETISRPPHGRRSPATACAPLRSRAIPGARPSSARASLSIRRGASRRGRGAASALSERLELQSQRVAQRSRSGLLQRGPVGGSRLGTSLLRSKNVPALRSVEGFEARMRLCFENFQRSVGLVVVEQDARQPECGDRAYLIAPRVIDDPLKLRARGLQVSRLKVDFGRHQRCERRVSAVRKVLQNRPRGFPGRLEIARARRLLQRVVQHGGVRGLRALIPCPAVPCSDRRAHERGSENDRTAMLLPPGLQGGELFLFFEVVCRHGVSKVPVTNAQTLCWMIPATRVGAIRTWASAARRGFRLTSPAASSSGPMMIAKRAPLESAFFICVLKLPPPACMSTMRPASRRLSARRSACAAVPSPT